MNLRADQFGTEPEDRPEQNHGPDNGQNPFDGDWRTARMHARDDVGLPLPVQPCSR